MQRRVAPGTAVAGVAPLAGSGDALELTVPVGELYDLEPTQAYRVALELGDRDLRVAARATLPPLA